MRAGALDQLITIQKPAGMRDSTGQVLDDWEDFAADVWASFEHVGGDESFTDPERRPKQSVAFECRFLAGVDATMRIVHKGQFYEITDVADIGRNEGLRISAFGLGIKSAVS